MSKITKSILMLQLLQTKGKWKISDLSEKLGISERMVKYYKQNLESAGVKIKTVRGKNGGYILEDEMDVPKLSLNEEELSNLKANILNQNIKDKIQNNIYVEKNKYYSLLNKHNIKHSKKEQDFIDAIIHSKKIKIVYYEDGNKMTIRNIEPVDVFCYEEKIYILAYCHLRKTIRNFDLEEISEYF